jgi:hypothetical protein
VALGASVGTEDGVATVVGDGDAAIVGIAGVADRCAGVADGSD